MVTKKEKDKAIAHRMRKDMYKFAESGKCQYWQDVKDYLLADGYERKMIRDEFSDFRKEELNQICTKNYKKSD